MEDTVECYSPFRFARGRNVPRLQFQADCIPIEICITLLSRVSAAFNSRGNPIRDTSSRRRTAPTFVLFVRSPCPEMIESDFRMRFTSLHAVRELSLSRIVYESVSLILSAFTFRESSSKLKTSVKVVPLTVARRNNFVIENP